MKKLLIALFMLVGVALNAQYKDIKGLVFHAKSSSGSSVNQIYDISFSDGFLVHNVLTSDGEVSAVQFYKIFDIQRTVEAGNTYIKFNAISGASGLSYHYTVKINSDGQATLILKGDSGDTVYTGDTYSIKTYDQNPE